MLTWFAILDSSSKSLEVARRQMPKAASRAPPLRAAGLEEEDPEPAPAAGRHRVNQGSNSGMSTQSHSRPCCEITAQHQRAGPGCGQQQGAHCALGSMLGASGRLGHTAQQRTCLVARQRPAALWWPLRSKVHSSRQRIKHVHCNLRGPSDMNLLPYGGCVCAFWAVHDVFFVASSTLPDRSPRTSEAHICDDAPQLASQGPASEGHADRL